MKIARIIIHNVSVEQITATICNVNIPVLIFIMFRNDFTINMQIIVLNLNANIKCKGFFSWLFPEEHSN